ncbi:MAG: dTDP-4-amino-4,6-dideoxygalactose transaminase [Desulfobacteraceae bacterium]|nr:dTDP-4-amino-4,6-dideoxygalactose transaminase [Desulfobacteraceae bacterium]
MSDQISFNKPVIAGKEMYYMAQAILGGPSAGDGPFTMKCQKCIEELLHTPKALLTQSYASALDMAAILCEVGPGDEVIMPSFAFVSVANSFYVRGAKPVFVDIRPDTLNIDESKIEQAVTERTRVIVTPHYAGIGCEIETIMDIAGRNGILVVEDAANGFGSQYEGKYLGTIGDLGVISFHETNNIMCGEGGALLINNERFCEKAEIIREKGTNRSKFFRGEVDKYTWVEIGSSFLPSDLVAAFLYAQLEMAEQIITTRSRVFNLYMEGLQDLENKGVIRLPVVQGQGACNCHIMYIITHSLEERTNLMAFLKDRGINAVFHYIPLHTSPMGEKHCRAHGDLPHTVHTSARLLRLPMYYEIQEPEVEQVVAGVRAFYQC